MSSPEDSSSSKSSNSCSSEKKWIFISLSPNDDKYSSIRCFFRTFPSKYTVSSEGKLFRSLSRIHLICFVQSISSKNEKFTCQRVSEDFEFDNASMNISHTAPVSFKSFKSRLSIQFDYDRNSLNHESNLCSCIQLSLKLMILKLGFSNKASMRGRRPSFWIKLFTMTIYSNVPIYDTTFEISLIPSFSSRFQPIQSYLSLAPPANNDFATRRPPSGPSPSFISFSTFKLWAFSKKGPNPGTPMGPNALSERSNSSISVFMS